MTAQHAAAPLARSQPRRLSVLGASGSVGGSTVDVIAAHPDRFCVEAIVGGSNAALLARHAKQLNARIAVVADDARFGELKQHLAGTGIEAAAGERAVLDAASIPVDMVMAAIVGTAGLAPTLAAMRAGADIALANKECLVTAGDFFMREAARLGRTLIPVDSEHSAIFQALAGSDVRQIERIILTASGGPFRQWTQGQMACATIADALKHPVWSMGAKITVDSATMMNKGLELIEAHHLFGLPGDKIEVLIHPQSVIHGIAAFSDGSMLAQMGAPDMRTPIAVALAWPERIAADVPRLDLAALQTLQFAEPDLQRFPAIRIAREALAAGGAFTAVLNAANEVAVDAFRGGSIGYLDIASLVESALDWAAGRFSAAVADLPAIIGVDRAAREYAAQCVARDMQAKA